ncbi:MAG: segregation/condensation protein A, partial [Chitinivibrionales bacterium]|nr:segregation/condensation protein A [Chitinivibrionales bacterium]
QYMLYLELMQELNIVIASEYLYMASTLVRLKAQEMLPDAEVETAEEAEEIVNRQQLIEKLMEYKKYKEAAHSLKVYENENYGTFFRGKHEHVELAAETTVDFGSLSVFDLVAAFKRIVERGATDIDPTVGHVIKPEDVKLDDTIEHVLGMLEDRTEVRFDELFGKQQTRLLLVVTFMAILELAKMRKLLFRQENHCGNLFVRKKCAVVEQGTPSHE